MSAAQLKFDWATYYFPEGITLIEIIDWLNDRRCFALQRKIEAEASITCPRCGRISYNPNDIKEHYCGYCHQWHINMKGLKR